MELRESAQLQEAVEMLLDHLRPPLVWTTRLVASCKSISNLVGKAGYNALFQDFCCLRGRSHFPSMQEVVGVGSTLGPIAFSTINFVEG